jgi:predicted DNA-binding protein YlxM (UPF0122 family)
MDEIEQFHFGEFFKHMLRRKDISVREVAKETGKSTQAIYSFLRTQSPRMDMVLEVSLIVGFKDFVNELILKIDKVKMSFSFDEDGHFIPRRLEYEDYIAHRRSAEKLVEEKPTEIENYEDKILSLEKSLNLAEQVIKAKDELIDHLKIKK